MVRITKANVPIVTALFLKSSRIAAIPSAKPIANIIKNTNFDGKKIYFHPNVF